MKIHKISPIRPKCGITRCSKSHYAKGYCQMHYNRVWSNKTGKINLVPGATRVGPNANTRGKCSFKDCGYDHYAKSLCQTHYMLVRSVSVVTQEDRRCSVRGCKFKHDSKGLCKFHYQLLRTQGIALNIKNYSNFEEESE
jgi:hypothetical protein